MPVSIKATRHGECGHSFGGIFVWAGPVMNPGLMETWIGVRTGCSVALAIVVIGTLSVNRSKTRS